MFGLGSGSSWLMEDLRKRPIGPCNGMSLRALQVTPVPSLDIGFALLGGGTRNPLCNEWQESATTFLVASEHWAVHRIADRVCEFH